ncbi:hypothetical protein SBC2_84220 (plasmid) [Caballeronia sp. SBC2]|nr:hypothetical protein SBC2_84220 [Caballeronia sp. SBC2]
MGRKSDSPLGNGKIVACLQKPDMACAQWDRLFSKANVVSPLEPVVDRVRIEKSSHVPFHGSVRAAPRAAASSLAVKLRGRQVGLGPVFERPFRRYVEYLATRALFGSATTLSGNTSGNGRIRSADAADEFNQMLSDLHRAKGEVEAALARQHACRAILSGRRQWLCPA